MSLSEAVHGAETIQSAFKRTACRVDSQPILSAIANYLTCFLAFSHLLHINEQFILRLNLMSCTTFSEWNSITTTNQVLLVCWWQSLHRYIYKQKKHLYLIQIALTYMNIATAGMYLTYQINIHLSVPAFVKPLLTYFLTAYFTPY